MRESPAAKASNKLIKAPSPTKSLRKVVFSPTLKTFDSRTARMTSLYSCTAGFLSASSSCVERLQNVLTVIFVSSKAFFLSTGNARVSATPCT